MREMEERVAGAIMRAYFSRPVDEQYISITLSEQLDLARAAIEEIWQAMGNAALADVQTTPTEGSS